LTNDQYNKIFSSAIQIIPTQSNLGINEKKVSMYDFKEVKSDIKGVWIIQFIGPIKQDWINQITNYDIKTHGYIFPYSIYVYATSTQIYKLKKNKYIQSVERYEYKCNNKCDGEMTVHYFPWNQSGPKCIKTNQELSECVDVKYIERYYNRKTLTVDTFNDKSKSIINSVIAYQNNITGKDQVIAVTDTGISKKHEMFLSMNKIISEIDISGDSDASFGDGDGHGTHVAGSIAGDAPEYNKSNKHDGQGYNASLISVKVFDNSGNWAGNNNEYNIWKQAYDLGARINNNSWGADTSGEYISSDHDADLICVNFPDYVLSVASGNSGPLSKSIGSPGVAKNVITVGSCQTLNPSKISEFSSRGPTVDNRIKPDVIAPGDTIISAGLGSVDEYIPLRGTSMATPQVSGVISLIKQAFTENKYNNGIIKPSSSLIKALLINGAVSLTDLTVPNNIQGWGRIDVNRSLPFDPNRQIIMWDLPIGPVTGNKNSHEFIIENMNINQIKINLVWIDPPGNVGSDKHIVNNLNIRVICPNNQIFLGNNFTGINPSYSIIGGKFDYVNNVQGIYLVSGYSFGTNQQIPIGKYTIEIISTNMTVINKGYSLVVGIDKSTLSKKIGVVGDYNNQLKTYLINQGYIVDTYTNINYSILYQNIDNYSHIILNQITNTLNLTKLSKSKIIFLCGYPVTSYGLNLILNQPKKLIAKWKQGAVKIKVSQIHPIFGLSKPNDIITIINGGDNDYQIYSSLINGITIGHSGMRESGGMIGIHNNHIYLTNFGLSIYTNLTHWTNEGKLIFNNILKFC